MPIASSPAKNAATTPIETLPQFISAEVAKASISSTAAPAKITGMDKRKLNYTRYQMEERQEKPLMLEEFNSNNTVQLTVAQVKEYLLKLSFVQEELKNWSSDKR